MPFVVGLAGSGEKGCTITGIVREMLAPLGDVETALLNLRELIMEKAGEVKPVG